MHKSNTQTAKFNMLLFLSIFLCYHSSIARSFRPKPLADSAQYYQNLAAWFQRTPQFNLDSINHFYTQADRYVKRQNANLNLNLAVIYKNKAQFYFHLHRMIEAKAFAQKAHEYLSNMRNKDPFLAYEIGFLQAIVLVFEGEKKRGLQVFTEAEKLVINNSNPDIQARYLGNRAYIYHIINIKNQDEQSYKDAQKSIASYLQLHNPLYDNDLSKVYATLSMKYEDEGNIKIENHYIDLSEKYAISAHNPYFICFHWLCRAEQFFKGKQFVKAKIQNLKVINQLKKYKLENTNYYQYALQYLGDIKKEQLQIDSAIHFYKRSFEVLKNIGYEAQRISILKKISDTYKQQGNHKYALIYYEQYAEGKLKREMDLSERSMRASDLEKEVLTKQNDLQRANTNRNILLGGVLFLCLLASIIFYYYQNQKKLNVLLQTRNEEKEVLLKEIHHRVKNNLTVISSLLETQSYSIEDETAKANMLEGHSRVKSIALIHQKLYQNDSLATVNFRSFLDDLYKQIASVFLKNGQKVIFTNRMHDTKIDIDTAVPLGLISNELFTNSFKYALKNKSTCEISVNITQIADGEFQFCYEDTGEGLPEDFEVSKAKSMGLRLINRLSKQLSGKFTYHKKQKTACFLIDFKNTETRNKE